MRIPIHFWRVGIIYVGINFFKTLYTNIVVIYVEIYFTTSVRAASLVDGRRWLHSQAWAMFRGQ